MAYQYKLPGMYWFGVGRAIDVLDLRRFRDYWA